jgi:predicted XRE-type DNA-binding protein
MKDHSPSVTPEMAAKIKHLLATGMLQHHIAAKFGINQGRVSEINRGKRFKDTAPDDQGSLF